MDLAPFSFLRLAELWCIYQFARLSPVSGGDAQWVKCLPHKHEDLSPDPQDPSKNAGVALCTGNPSPGGWRQNPSNRCPSNLTKMTSSISVKDLALKNSVEGQER